MDDGSACTSNIPKDAKVAGCASWCAINEAYSHCQYCKCASCGFCTPEDEIDHVYASAGGSMVDCDEPLALSEPLRGVNLDRCKAECDDAFPACQAFDYAGRQQLCTLRAGEVGEPLEFCSAAGSSTFWRVDIPGASTDDAVDMSSNAADAEAEAEAEMAAARPPRRIEVRARALIDSESGEEVTLHGVNVFLDYLRFDDVALLKQLLPTANMVRLVGVFWNDVSPGPPPDDGSPPPVCPPADPCCVDDAAVGYFAPKCLADLRRAITRLTDAGLWVIVAAKARFAAGEGWPQIPDVFHDDALSRRYEALWRHLARALVAQPNIAGYEVLSEPRNKVVDQNTVRRFYERVCAGVHTVDARVPCVVGPSPYYKIWNLNETMVLRTPSRAPMANIVYTFDFYDPWDYITNDPSTLGYGYPDDYPCSIAFRGWVRLFRFLFWVTVKPHPPSTQ